MKKEPCLKFKAVSCHPNARNWREILLKKGTGFLENGVLLDKSGFDMNMHRSRGQSSRGKPAIDQTASIRANLQTVVGIISASGVVPISMRERERAQESSKQVVGATKRKAPDHRIFVPKDTTSDHYV